VRDDTGARATNTVRVTNFGAKRTNQGATVGIWLNANGIDLSKDPEWSLAAAKTFPIPQLEPGDSRQFSWTDVELPEDHGIFSFTARIQGASGETQTINDEATRWFTVP
jgi:hypothetical protein